MMPMRPMQAKAIASVAAALFEATYAASVLANPTGAQVVAGRVTVSTPSSSQMNITQGTTNAIVNWNTFSIGAGQSVNIAQPSAQAALLNRVTGNDPSTIAGSLRANGKVFLINPAGVIFAPGSAVNVGSLVASTLNIADADFLAGNFHFVGKAPGAVSNAGTITAANGGTIALLGGTVSNSGTVSAKLGTVALGAGGDITLDFAGDGLTTLRINAGTANALLGNTGTLAADGGTVVMSAQTAEALANAVINQQGVVRAESLAERNGHIILDGGTNGETLVGGTLDASGGAGLSGGQVDVTGYDVALLAGATIDANGAAGGGSVRFGGGAAGKDPTIADANAVWMDLTAQIEADALVSGNGGHIVAFGTTAARLYGTFSARGGAQGGNGGLIETSGGTLDVGRATVDASAPMGHAGTWLLDPVSIEICASATCDTGTSPGTVSGSTILFGPTDSPLLDSEISSQLSGGTSVTVQTSAGDIVVDSGVNIAKTAGNDANLTLNASGNITFDSPATITSSAGKLNVDLEANVGGTAGNNAVTLNGTTINTNGGTFTIGNTGQSAVDIQSSTIDTVGGALGVAGTASSGDAVVIGYSLISTGAGGLSISGTSLEDGNGINVSQSALQSSNGNISLTGTADASGVIEGNVSGITITDDYVSGGVTTPAIDVTGSGGVTITGNAAVTSGSNGEGNGVSLLDTSIVAGSGGLSVVGTSTAPGGGEGSGTSTGISITDSTLNGTTGVTSMSGTGPFGGIALGYSLIATTGGDIKVSGLANFDGSGVNMLESGIQSSAGGSILANGTSTASGSLSIYGMEVVGNYVTPSGSAGGSAFSTTGNGTITLSGSADDSTGVTYGFQMENAAISGAAGEVAISGTSSSNGATSASFGDAIGLNGVTVSTTSGLIDLTSTGAGPYGIATDISSSSLTSTSGNVSIGGTMQVSTAVGGAPYDTMGTEIQNSLVTAGGNVSVSGSVVGAGEGVEVNFSGLSANGSISLTGSAQGDVQSYSTGVQVWGTYGPSDGGPTLTQSVVPPPAGFPAGVSPALYAAGSGGITINGSAGGFDAAGVYLVDTLLATVNGPISVTGAATASSYGIGVQDIYSALRTSGGGVTLKGNVTDSATAPLSLATGVQVQAPGTFTGSSNNTVKLPSIQTTSGAIAVTGSVPASTSGSIAVDIDAAQIQSSSGAISFTGNSTGTAASGVRSDGVVLQNSFSTSSGSETITQPNTAITTGSGALTIYGSGLGSGVEGVLVTDGSTITSNNGGAIDMRGVATSPTTSASGGNVQDDYGTLVYNGTISSTAPGSTVAIAGSTNTSDAGLAFGAVPVPANSGFTSGTVSVNVASGGTLALRAANDNTSTSLVSKSATLASPGGTLAILPASVDPTTFAFVAQDATPVTLFGPDTGGLSIDMTTFGSFSGFATLALGSSTQTGLIAVDGMCASGNTCATPTKPTLDMNLTLSNPGSGSQGIQFPFGISVGNNTLALDSAGAVTDPGGIQAAGLLLAGPGTFTLNDPQNDVGVLAMVDAGTVNFLNSVGFVIGPIVAHVYDATSGALTTIDGTNSTLTGNLLAQAATGGIGLGGGTAAAGGPTGGVNTNLSAGGTIDLVMENGVFTDNGTGTVSATNGWRIWASTWTGETRGNVQPDTSQPNFYGCSYGAGCVWGGSVPLTGDHFVYIARPTVIVTANGTTKVEGAPDPAFSFTTSGLINGDTAAGTLTGSLSTPATQNSPPGQYPINPAFLSSVGYVVVDDPGTLTVTAPPMTLDPDMPLDMSALQSFFGASEKTFVYENNLQGTNICVGSNEPLFTNAPPGDNQDLLAVEWKRVRSQPNLNSCMLINGQHGCGDF